MTTKEYLNRAYVLNKKIKKDKEIIANLKDAAMNTSANISDERVQTSAPTGSRMSTFVENDFSNLMSLCNACHNKIHNSIGRKND